MVAPHSDLPSADEPSLTKAKQEARRLAVARRAGLVDQPGEVARLLERLELLVAGFDVVGAVWPLPGEVDLRPLLARLHGRGQGVALPETTPRGQPLLFRRWHPDVVLRRGRFGTVHPESEPVMPDVLLVPLLAFDRRLARLGYGGGYYDRTLARLPGRPAIGFAFAAQEIDHVPTGTHDVPLSAIATERELLVAPVA